MFNKFIKETNLFLWLCCLVAVLSLCYIVFNEIQIFLGETPKIYIANHLYVWVTGYFAALIFTFKPLFKLSYKSEYIQMQGWAGFGFLFLLIVFYFLHSNMRPYQFNGDSLTAFFGVITLATATLVWLVANQQTRLKHKKEHTFKVILDSRHSEVFHRHAMNMKAVYPGDKHPEPKDADCYFLEHDNTLPKVKAIMGIIHIVDYYEFIAAGVAYGDLDEEFLYTVARGYMSNIWGKAENIRKHNVLRGQPKAWCELRKLVERWETRYKKEMATHES